VTSMVREAGAGTEFCGAVTVEVIEWSRNPPPVRSPKRVGSAVAAGAGQSGERI